MNTRQPAIRDVGFHAPPGLIAEAEVTDLAGLRQRGGLQEFADPQRLAFELVIQVLSGHAAHDVDFASYALSPGDVLWVHAGQVQHWGDVSAIEGRAILFPPTMLDVGTSALLRRLGALARNHWPSVAVLGSPLDEQLRALERLSGHLHASTTLDPEARAASMAHAVLAALLRIAGDARAEGESTAPADQVFRWFEEAVEHNFTSERSVGSYARRLGYSERTLNRAARAEAGTTAKGLVDRRVILEAKRLLAHQVTPVADIATHLGFQDPANFHKYFLKNVGTTPGAFRKAIRGQ